MSDSGKIYLSSLSSKHLELAKSVNKDGNEFLSGEEISIFLAECELNGIDFKPSIGSILLNTALTMWDSCVESVSKFFDKKEVTHKKEILGPPVPEYLEMPKKAYQKWSKVFTQSPLKEYFYLKLYDVMERLNIKIDDWDSEKYDSPKAQAFNEIIAILAGESQLKPDSKNGPYRGLFQLATAGLKDLKTWARTNEDGSTGLVIDQNIDIEGFAKLTGEEQLDYLVAYIEKMKEYSGIGKDESITPSQMWAMIKYPFRGKDGKLVNEKNNAINKVISLNKIETKSILRRDDIA